MIHDKGEHIPPRGCVGVAGVVEVDRHMRVFNPLSQRSVVQVVRGVVRGPPVKLAVPAKVHVSLDPEPALHQVNVGLGRRILAVHLPASEYQPVFDGLPVGGFPSADVPDIVKGVGPDHPQRPLGF